MSIKLIETNGLTLRPYVLTDYQPYMAMRSDPAVVRFLGGRPFSPEDTWHRVLRYAGHWSFLGHGIFAVIEKDSGDYIGETGIADFRRGLGDGFDGFGEASWAFTSRVHGLGFAFEAAHKWYIDSMRQRRTVCLVDPDNISSLRMAKRLGYTAFGERTYKNRPMTVLERSVSA